MPKTGRWTARIAFWVTPAQKKKLQEIAYENGISMNQALRNAVSAIIREEESIDYGSPRGTDRRSG